MSKNESIYKELLDCTSCQNFRIEKNKCLCVKGMNKGEEYTGYQPCYAPSVFFMRPAVRELLDIQVHNANAQASIGAAILIDLYKGASNDLIQQKYADTYGQVGHEESGYVRPCRAALDAMVFSESSVMFRKWFENYQAQARRMSSRNASVVNAVKNRSRTDVVSKEHRIFSIGDTEYFVLEQPHSPREGRCIPRSGQNGA